MAKGLSLHIGVNICSGEHYGGWEGPLQFCEADAESALEIAESLAFKESIPLMTKAATRDAVIQGINDAASNLESGDLFFLTYAGHGGQIRDTNNDEADGADETWCLYDGQLLDDELEMLWSNFKPGVRILVLSDSCHSGTVTRDMDANPVSDLSEEDSMAIYGTTEPSFRFMPREVATEVYIANRPFYDGLQRDIPTEKSPVQASVLLISGCKDEQLSGEAWGHGLFTASLLKSWDGGAFEAGYEAFHKQILSGMPKRQQPELFRTGVDNPEFLAQKPFTI